MSKQVVNRSIIESVKEGIKVKSLKDYTPSEFFVNRNGLYPWNSFIENVVKKATKVKEDTEFTISSFDLTKNATDKEIESELPNKYIFSETNVCAIIASLIEKQSKGQKGTLQNNGYANLFYTKSRVVCVFWSDGGWLVFYWIRDGFTWNGGTRVFSSATDES